MIRALLALVVALPALAAGPYPIKEAGSRCRTGPGTSFSVVKQYALGRMVTLVCQTEGENINGNTIWDKTTEGCFVSDYLVKTGTNDYVAPRCNSSPNPPSGKPCALLNAAGIALVKEFEGFVPSPAPDPIGLPTVGYGHLCETKGCGEVRYKFPLTQATASQLLNDDLPRYTTCLGEMLGSGVTLNDNQWAALTSWVYNLGCGQTKSSTAIRRINAGENPTTVVEQEFPKWVYAGGQKFSGLVRRRDAEIALCKKPSSKQAYPKCT
ncbi:hypothetical protein CspeluHIS016_0100950 [Cutaneotrichosporon spelunceum]|uniref:Lysozyme n=1 Tax=Cutaneotrichosporon spelunceum TaxID=1672016 RepID=A0AAD3TN27_9TREE|nr:hypothetical protein CspeluHIS016_0100950 [Cutaneotrichosporon spelunceum]